MFLDLPPDVPITQNILHLALYFLLQHNTRLGRADTCEIKQICE